jgi:hypothetical protein
MIYGVNQAAVFAASTNAICHLVTPLPFFSSFNNPIVVLGAADLVLVKVYHCPNLCINHCKA